MDPTKANTGTFYLTVVLVVLTVILVGLGVAVWVYPNPQVPSLQGALLMKAFLGTCILVVVGLQVLVAYLIRGKLRKRVADLTEQNTSLRSDTGRLRREKGLCQDNYQKLEKESDKYSSELAEVKPQIESLGAELAQAKRDIDNARKKGGQAENESQAHYKLFEDRERQLADFCG